jgi:hypothetical protein
VCSWELSREAIASPREKVREETDDDLDPPQPGTHSVLRHSSRPLYRMGCQVSLQCAHRL